MEAAVAQFKDLVSSESGSPLMSVLCWFSPPGVAGNCIGLMAGELHQPGGQPGRGTRLPGWQALLRPRQSALPHPAVQGSRTHKTAIEQAEQWIASLKRELKDQASVDVWLTGGSGQQVGRGVQ